MNHVSWQEQSRQQWGRQDCDPDVLQFSVEQLQVGALCRIATSLEKIAKLLDPVERRERAEREKRNKEKDELWAAFDQRWQIYYQEQRTRIAQMNLPTRALEKAVEHAHDKVCDITRPHDFGLSLSEYERLADSELEIARTMPTAEVIAKGIEASKNAPRRRQLLLDVQNILQSRPAQ